MKTIRRLVEKEFLPLHHMMVAQKFPNVPKTSGESFYYMQRARIWGLFEEEDLSAAFIFGDITQDAAYLDVVCAPEMHGRWATKRVLKHLYQDAFVEMDLKFIWAEARTKQALKTCIKGGFVLANPIEAQHHVLILTKDRARKLLKISNMEN